MPAGSGDPAIAAWVKKLGGHYIQQNRIREVNLSHTPVSDTQLRALAGLAGIEKLSLATTQIRRRRRANVAKLTTLRELDLSEHDGDRERDCASVGTAPYCQRLVLNNSQVRGDGFESLAGSPLVSLELSGAPVNDAGLRAIGNLKSLRQLRLNSTDITDDGIASIAALGSLEALDISATDIGDAGLAHLKSLTGLHSLKLSYSRVTNKGLQQLAGFTALEQLDLARTRISDPGVDAIAKLQAIKKLSLDYTTVTNKGLAVVKQSLPNLVELTLDSANVGDESVEILRGMAGLRLLNLYHTLVTEKGYEELKKALPECRIIFDRDSSMPNRRRS